MSALLSTATRQERLRSHDFVQSWLRVPSMGSKHSTSLLLRIRSLVSFVKPIKPVLITPLTYWPAICHLPNLQTGTTRGQCLTQMPVKGVVMLLAAVEERSRGEVAHPRFSLPIRST